MSDESSAVVSCTVCGDCAFTGEHLQAQSLQPLHDTSHALTLSALPQPCGDTLAGQS